MKFRKKPVVIEAWQWLFNDEQEETPTWVYDALNRWPDIGGLAFEPEHDGGARICISTLDAVAIAVPGDYIVKGVKGELYPCKPDIFEETYEPESGKERPQDPEMRAMGKQLDIAKRALDCLAGGEFATVEDTIRWAQGVLDDIEGPKDRPVLPREEPVEK